MMKLVGILILAALYIGLFIFCSGDVGIKEAFKIFLIANGIIVAILAIMVAILFAALCITS